MKSDMTPMTSSTTPRSFTIVAAMRIGCRMMAMPIRLMTYRRAGRMTSEFADGSVSGLLDGGKSWQRAAHVDRWNGGRLSSKESETFDD